MANAWTDITNAQVAAGAAISTALMTALRDNPEGIAHRATGAPKIYGVPYDFQEFTAGGTWTKPSNAATGDTVLVQCVGGGGAGTAATDTNRSGGGGGGGGCQRFDIDDLPASASVAVGSGGAANKGNGTDSSFGTSGDDWYVEGEGGFGGDDTTSATNAVGGRGGNAYLGRTLTGGAQAESFNSGGSGGSQNNSPSSNNAGGSSIGGGGGGACASAVPGGTSMFAGGGGDSSGTAGLDGMFPGGGGASGSSTAGDGAAGVVRVWCFREEA